MSRNRHAASEIDPAPQRRSRKICVAVDQGSLLRWHLWLIASLREHYDVALISVPMADVFSIPPACRLVFEIERLIYRIPPDTAVDPIDARLIDAPFLRPSDATDTFDVAIDLTGVGGRAIKALRVLTVLFNDAPGEIGTLAALLDDRCVRVTVEDFEQPGAGATAFPALADRKVMTLVFDNVCSIAVDLVIKALQMEPPKTVGGIAQPQPAAQRRWPAAAMAYLASGIVWKANRLLSSLLAGQMQWSVAYRKIDDGCLMTRREGEFILLPDDGRRYFADPFLLRYRGRTTLFMEEFPFDTMRGRIAVATIEDDGTVTPPRPVLEEGHHLSYPNVFEHDGEIWMVPELGADAGVDLYRAVDFPFRWRREARLLEGMSAYDATFLRNSTGWWMFAATRTRRATGWDSLSVFHAPDIRGPWRPCVRNPVVLDARAARPAGAVIYDFGAPLRPVQDCEAYYGAAIGLWRIDRIDCEIFKQTQVARITSGRLGVHTYNKTHGFEVVDLFGRTRGRRSATLACEAVGPPSAAAASASHSTSCETSKLCSGSDGLPTWWQRI